MVIVALDTTTRGGSVALWRDGRIDERAGDAARTHAERLPADLAALVADHGVALSEVERYAVLTGPGSFTGMRVGIATIQALALVHSRLVFPMSTLEALARAGAAHARPGGIVAAWMEAYRGEVFGAVYRLSDGAESPAGLRQDRPIELTRELTGGVSLVPADRESANHLVPHQLVQRAHRTLAPLTEPVVADPRTLAAHWAAAWGQPLVPPPAGASPVVVIVGDAVPAHEAMLRETFGPHAVLLDAPLLAGVLAGEAAHDPAAAVRPHAIVPLYVRRPDVELTRDRVDEARRREDAAPVR